MTADATNFTYNLDYTGKTNAPVIQVYWPQNGDLVSGTNFTLRGALDDFTATLTAQIVNSSGDTNTIQGLVERNGLYWVENAPLLAGTNYVTLTAMDAVGNITTTNLTIDCVNAGVTVNDFSGALGGTERNVLCAVTGTATLTNCTFWVNGFQATQSGGSWTATAVPVGPGGTAVVEARAIPNTAADNYGNGTGMAPPTDGTPNNPTAPDAVACELQLNQPTVWYVPNFHYNSSYTANQNQTVFGYPLVQTTETAQVDYAYTSGGTADDYYYYTYTGDGDWGAPLGTFTLWQNAAYSWSCDSCPVTGVYTDNSGDTSTNENFYYGLPFGAPLPASVIYYNYMIPLGLFNLDIHIPGELYNGVTYLIDQTESFSTPIAIQIGGKGAPGLQNVCELSLSAASYQSCGVFNPVIHGWIPDVCGTTIPDDEIVDLGQTANSYGQVAETVPNNITVSATPALPSPAATYDINVNVYAPIWLCWATISTNRTTRTTIGVGEQVSFGFLQDLPTNVTPTWTLSGGGALNTNVGSVVTLTAPSNKSTVSIKATIGNAEVDFPDFSVVEPASLSYQVSSTNSFPSGTQGVGMGLLVTCLPTNVSFYMVQYIELPGPAINVSGCFTNVSATNLEHSPNTNWVVLTQANHATNSDEAEFDSVPQPWSPGEYDWSIPMKWQIIGSNATNNYLPNVLQRMIIDNTNGTSTVIKGSAQTTRTP